MALFSQYTKPGVYTEKLATDDSVNLFGDLRVPIFVGEGQEETTVYNYELNRGSSSQVDDLVVEEDISIQADGSARTFQLTYYPIVSGDGSGTTATDPNSVKLYMDGNPINVIQIDGKNGKVSTDIIVLPGARLTATYFFKKSDTQIKGEVHTNDVASFATYTAQTGLVLQAGQPGYLGNNVILGFTLAASSFGVSDLLAVTGIGTDVLNIELRKTDNSIRTRQDVANLIASGVATLSAGNITVVGSVVSGATAAIEVTALAFTGGVGPSTNLIFKVNQTPIVDGTNGGVVTNNPGKVTAYVNNAPVTVTAVDGATGLVTLAASVAPGSTLKFDYFTNKYQDTSDTLPSGSVSGIVQVGYAPNRADFSLGTDFTLTGNRLNWGNAATVVAGQTTVGATPLNGVQISTILVDEKVYLRPVTGTTDNVNTIFSLEDVPTDGSGLAVATDDAQYIKVYVGTNVHSAFAAGDVRVVRLTGASKTVKLYNAPAAGSNVYATYFRNTINDHTYTLKVATVGSTGYGSYKLTNETGGIAPVITKTGGVVADANFATTGIVWPSAKSDMHGIAGASLDEVLTITFNATNGTDVTVPAVQAFNTSGVKGVSASNYVRLQATEAGTVGNSVRVRTVSNIGTGAADAAAVTVSGEDITVELIKADGSTVRTINDVASLFTIYTITTANAGRITGTVNGDGTVQTQVAGYVAFSGGVDATTVAHARQFDVTSSLGILGTRGTGVLGQTYIDANTGVSFTLVDPADALSYGYTQLPSPQYKFATGDTLIYTVSTAANWTTSVAPVNAVPGINLVVLNTLGSATNDTATVATYAKSGAEPAVGEFYYVTYKVAKTAFGLSFYTDLSKVLAAYGPATPNNKLSLAAQLAFQNGATTIGCYQVVKSGSSETADDQSFMTAIADLNKPFPGSDRKADVIVPLSTSPTVQQYLSKHLTVQATPRYKGEAMGIVGFPIGTKDSDATAIARGIKNERVIAVYPAGAILTLDFTGTSLEYTVGGEFQAAALAGAMVNPAIDEATTLTRKNLVGFTRLLVNPDDVAMDRIAADGLTLLTNVNGAFQIRHYITTDPSTPLKREPTNITIEDRVRKQIRKVLEPFIGRKALASLSSDISLTTVASLRALVEQEIIEGYKNVTAFRDESDPSVMHVKFAFKPLFSLLWIDVQFSVTTRL